MAQDFNSTGSLLERIAQEPEQRSWHIDEAVTGVEERICSLYGEGAEGNTKFEHLRRRLMIYGSYDAGLKEATARGLKDTINKKNGFDLDLINQIFIARFQDFEALMGGDFPAVFDESDVNFLSGEARLLRNEVTIYRNLSLIVNQGGKRRLNGDYNRTQRGRADRQFREFREMSKLVMGGFELLLAERYNIETEFRRFSEQPTYEQYQMSLSSIEELRAKVIETASGIRATSIRSAAEYLMALCDHYASIINYEFLKKLNSNNVISNEINLREMQRTSNALAGKNISRLAFPQKLSDWLPTLDAEVARFYENGNVGAYFADLRKIISTRN